MSNAFQEFIDSIPVATERIAICTDVHLAKRAGELRNDIAELKAALLAEVPDDGALSEGTREGRLAELREHLAQMEQQMESKSIYLEVRSPSEDLMASLEELRESDTHEWLARVIQAAAVSPEMTLEQVKQLRARLDRGSWNTLYSRVMDVAVNRSLTLPLSSSTFGETPA